MVETATGQATLEVPPWLPMDTEESVVGTQWHQEAIDALATMIVEAGRRHGAPWGVARGIALLGTGARYPNGKPYDPKPDVMVLAHPLPDDDIAGVALTDVGIPLFIAEVASRVTWGNDLGFKKEVYEFVRVPEYILFDAAGHLIAPALHLIAPALHAWRIEGDAYVPWVAAVDGWWHSAALEIALRPTQPFLTVRDREGRQVGLPRQVFEREDRLERALAEAQRRIAEMDDRLRHLQDNHNE